MTNKHSIGQRRRRLVLEAPIETFDGAGGVARTWTSVATFWAAVEAVETSQDAERERADRPELAMRYRLTARWRAGVDGTMRLREGARILRILGAADPDGRRRHLVLVAEEVTP